MSLTAARAVVIPDLKKKLTAQIRPGRGPHRIKAPGPRVQY
jgi:hypothetical protein